MSLPDDDLVVEPAQQNTRVAAMDRHEIVALTLATRDTV